MNKQKHDENTPAGSDCPVATCSHSSSTPITDATMRRLGIQWGTSEWIRTCSQLETDLAAARSRIAMQDISLSQWRKSDELGLEEFNAEQADKERALVERDASRREAEEFRDNMNRHLTEGDGKFSWENKENTHP